jgi:hypothetical protein
MADDGQKPKKQNHKPDGQGDFLDKSLPARHLGRLFTGIVKGV